jgi:hypothetical protein
VVVGDVVLAVELCKQCQLGSIASWDAKGMTYAMR